MEDYAEDRARCGVCNVCINGTCVVDDRMVNKECNDNGVDGVCTDEGECEGKLKNIFHTTHLL